MSVQDITSTQGILTIVHTEQKKDKIIISDVKSFGLRKEYDNKFIYYGLMFTLLFCAINPTDPGLLLASLFINLIAFTLSYKHRLYIQGSVSQIEIKVGRLSHKERTHLLDVVSDYISKERLS